MNLVAVDLGGTHVRFAIASLTESGDWSIGDEAVLATAEHASFERAWEAYAASIARELPPLAAVAVAAPADAEVIKLTNNPWVLRRGELQERLKLRELVFVNDFAAVAHAVDLLRPEHLRHLCGPYRELPEKGVITILGPGTGFGVAQLLRGEGAGLVVPTEGGHMDFAPLDSIDDALLALLRKRHRRVSVERVVAGPGLLDIYATLAALEQQAVPPVDTKSLWSLALSGADSLAMAALDRFCMSLGSVAGDLALAQGAKAVVVAGGLGLRLADHLPRSSFADRFVAKGRFEALMANIPVKLVVHPQPGLLGAAAAFSAPGQASVRRPRVSRARAARVR